MPRPPEVVVFLDLSPSLFGEIYTHQFVPKLTNVIITFTVKPAEVTLRVSICGIIVWHKPFVKAAARV